MIGSNRRYTIDDGLNNKIRIFLDRTEFNFSGLSYDKYVKLQITEALAHRLDLICYAIYGAVDYELMASIYYINEMYDGQKSLVKGRTIFLPDPSLFNS